MTPRGVERRELIASTARARFTTLGYDGTTIGDLAAELGLSKAAIAYYFPTKETFLDEFVAPFVDALDEAVSNAVSPRDMLAAYLSVIVAGHDIAAWVDTDPTIQNHPDFGARLDDINRRVIKAFTGTSRKKADRIRALGVLGGLWRPVREVSTADLTAHFDRIVDAAMSSY